MTRATKLINKINKINLQFGHIKYTVPRNKPTIERDQLEEWRMEGVREKHLNK
ncbi:MAG: hypothetical protein HOA84_03315 [Candidatus Jacksonbacteria bacterium]|nr:hypothetical protein [Candidatus Jacksonbacteria bacterium]